MTWNSRIRCLSLGVLLLVTVHITLLTGHLDPPRLFQRPPHDSPEPTQNCLAHEPLKQLSGEWDSSRVLKGPPTAKFRDNLLNNLSYITSGANAGLTNEFMSYATLIYLGMLSGRIPVIPPFAPDHHISRLAGALPFGQVFNLTRAQTVLRTPLVEWYEVKALPDPTSIQPPADAEREQLGCWSTRHENELKPGRVESIVNNLRLDVSYTRMAGEARTHKDNPEDPFLDLNHMVPYIFPNEPILPVESFPLMEESPLGHRLPPDEKMACFDYLYYTTSSRETFEWRFAWSPVWRFVAKHLHFTDHITDLAKTYLAKAFDTAENNIPPFIAVHMRRGDFKQQCHDGTPEDKCLMTLSRFKEEVDLIRQEIKRKQSRDVTDVILMSDERDPKFWEEVKSLGWRHMDHFKELTVEKYGEWIPPILDQAAQSLAAGFVGTEDSTFSLVSARRVQDWNNGPGVLIKRRSPNL